MGACWRKYHDHFEPDAAAELGGDRHTLLLQSQLYFSSADMDSLYTAFRDMDSDNSGVIRLDELLAYFHIKKTLLTEKIFEDKTSKYPSFLNFEQFVVYTWQFLSLRLEKVATFAFHLMDTKGAGYLAQDEVRYLVELMYNTTVEESKTIQKLVKKCNVLYGESLTLAEFESFSASHRLLCDPFRKTQISYQSKLLGRAIWKRIRLKREANLEGFDVKDNAADAILAKIRLERRMNTSLVELDQRRVNLEAKIEAMMVERDEDVSKRDVHLETEELTSDRIVMPIEGKIRVPKSSSQRRTPQLIPTSDVPKKKKKKRKSLTEKFEKATGDNRHSGRRRRHSMDDSPIKMLKTINNVEIFKSSSLDLCDDDCADNTVRIDDSIVTVKENGSGKKHNGKAAAVVPL